MELITAWIQAHPFVSGVISVIAGLAALWLAWWAFLIVLGLWHRWRHADRSGAQLTGLGFTVTHDEATDEAVFTWTLGNTGRFPSCSVRTNMTIRMQRTNGRSTSWREGSPRDDLKPGAEMEVVIRIARAELISQARDFDKGVVTLSASQSGAPPHQPTKGDRFYGPHLRYALAVGRLGDADCVMVTDATPLKPGQYM